MCKVFAQIRMSLIVVRGLCAPPSIISHQLRARRPRTTMDNGMFVQNSTLPIHHDLQFQPKYDRMGL